MSYEPPGFSRKSVYGHEKLYESSSKLGSTFLSSEKPVVNGAGRSLSRHDEEKQRRNYKLLIDPALKKGSQKIFRYDGEFDGQSPIVPKDPRSRRTRIWTLNKADLPVPNFKVDKYYVGIPPQREVVFTGLNDNVDRKFLQEMCQKYGKVENIKIYYDPLTKKHTGKAKVTFDLTKSSKLACSKLDGSSVMGNIISTQLEPNLKGLASRLKQQKGLEKPAKEPPFLHASKPSIHYPTPPSTNSHSPSLDTCLSTPTPPKTSRPVDPRIRNPPPPVTPPMPDSNTSGISSTFQQRSSLSSQLTLPGHGSAFSVSLSSSSSSSSFEPISPPPVAKKDVQIPVKDTALEGAPPLPPPMEQTSSFLSYEDISPEQPCSPVDKVRKIVSPPEISKSRITKTSGRVTSDESKIGKMIESLRKDSARHSPPRDRSRSPKSDKYGSRDYRSHYNDYNDKGDKHRDRYGDYHRDYRDDKDYRRDSKRADSSRYSGRSTNYNRHYESRKDSSYNDYKSRKNDYSRGNYRDDYDRRHGERLKDNSKYKRSERYTSSPRRPEDRDKYPVSPHRGEEKRKAESSESHGKEETKVREWHVKKSPNDYCENKNTENYSHSFTLNAERSMSPQKVGKSPAAVLGESPKEIHSDASLLGFSSDIHQNLNKRESGAYTASAEESNEEPLPPGDELYILHEKQLERSRTKLLNTQEVIRKRKLSHGSDDIEDESRTKRINVERSSCFVESEKELNKNISKELGDTQFSGQSIETTPEAIDNTLPTMVTELNGTVNAAHTALLQVEDISPCQSPLGVSVAGNAVVKATESSNIYSDIETNDDTDTEKVTENNGQNDDDDAMSLSSISSNEDTFELNEPSKKISPKPKPVTVPPPNIYSFLPPIIPPPPVMFNPHIPPPLSFPPLPLPPIAIPPPIPPPTLPPIPPPSVLPPQAAYSNNYPHQRLTSGYGSQGFEYRPTKQEKLWNWKRQIIDVVSGVVRNELDAVLSRDVFRKLVENSAFKSLEAWWENQSKPKIQPSIPSTVQQTSTVAQPTTSTPSTLLGPSPFDRSHSMAMGLRASLPKLPSFKRRPPEPKLDTKKEEEIPKTHSKTTLESSVLTKKRRSYDSESEHDAEVELSSHDGDKRPRTLSSLVDDGDEERSQSPWQLDDNLEAAPPATDVRITKAIDRRVSTGSSLYKTVYPSESEEDSESEEESEEKEESEESEESETDSSEEESDEESEEESEESEEEEEEEEDQVMESEKEIARVDLVEFKKPFSSDDAEETDISLSSTSQSQTLESELSDFDKEDSHSTTIKSTVETITLSQTTNYNRASGLAIQPRIDQEHEQLTETETEVSISEEEGIELQSDKFEEVTSLVSIDEKQRELEKAADKEVEEITARNEDVKPLLSPRIHSIASLVELDHSYGVRREETPPIDVVAIDQETSDMKFSINEKDFKDKLEEFEDNKEVKREKLLSPPPKHLFPVRSFEHDDELVYEFLKTGLDYEDAHFLRVGFDQLVQVCSDSVVGAKWNFHPVTAQPTNTPTPKRRRQKSEVGARQHVTGCARSEGYYKIDSKEKAKYAESAHRIAQHDGNDIAGEEPKLDASKGKQLSRENRAMQRRLQSAVCKEDFGDILKFNKLRVRKKQLKFAKSPIHDWGLIALEPIAADEMVIEYLGDVIRQIIADTRERYYEKRGIGSSYMFRLDEDSIIDATVQGNFARFINHCCDPNCYAKVIALENEKKIVIYSKRDIQVNEEITYDYKFPLEDEKIPCLCGSPHCRGTLN